MSVFPKLALTVRRILFLFGIRQTKNDLPNNNIRISFPSQHSQRQVFMRQYVQLICTDIFRSCWSSHLPDQVIFTYIKEQIKKKRRTICAEGRHLCWRERKLLVEPPMADRWKDRGQTKCTAWSSRLEVGPEITFMKPPDTVLGPIEVYSVSKDKIDQEGSQLRTLELNKSKTMSQSWLKLSRVIFWNYLFEVCSVIKTYIHYP
jgi:hypothetical protein